VSADWAGGCPDPRTRTFLPPARVVWSTEGAAAPLRPEVLLRSATIQAMVHTPEPACVLAAGASIVLDYGRELHGGLRLVTADNQPRVGRLRLRFGESVSEVMGRPDNDHALHDMELDVPWQGVLDAGNTGFRFVRLDALGQDARVELRAALAQQVLRDLPYVGSFRCSDDRLNRIWDTGAYTVHLNMQEYVWDGIKRDRLVWLGDLHPEVRVICSVFDDDGVVPASLDLARDNTPLPGYINGISSYSLWWIIIQRDWFLHWGDAAYLAAQRPYLLGLLEQLSGCVAADGREQLPAHRFLDWPTSDDGDAVHAGLQGLLSWACGAGAELCGYLDEEDGARRFAALRGQLRQHVPDVAASKQATAMQVLGGLRHAAAANADVLGRDPCAGMSTFYGYYVLQARALAGDVAGALEVIRRYWGAMLDAGATTFWEDFDLAWTRNAGRIDELPAPGRDDLHADFGNYCYKGLRHSLCHGWAGGPTAWLTEHVLGLRPTAPGCRRLAVTPRLGDLDWAEGSLPTPLGPVQVSHRRAADGRVETRLELPDGMERDGAAGVD